MVGRHRVPRALQPRGGPRLHAVASQHRRGARSRRGDGQLWISMDYVDGLDASRLVAERHPAGMPADDVARIVTAVASALDSAHKRGLLHRDVKPANIMLTHLDDDGEQRILLTDFGIARDVNEADDVSATTTGIGTVAYCAPEQLSGDEVGPRADQYALAATAYQLLTGEPLFPRLGPRRGDLRPPQLEAADAGGDATGTRRARPRADRGAVQATRKSFRPLLGLRARPEREHRGAGSARGGRTPELRSAARGRHLRQPLHRAVDGRPPGGRPQAQAVPRRTRRGRGRGGGRRWRPCGLGAVAVVRRV